MLIVLTVLFFSVFPYRTSITKKVGAVPNVYIYCFQGRRANIVDREKFDAAKKTKLVAKIGFDTAEKEPSEIWQYLANILMTILARHGRSPI